MKDYIDIGPTPVNEDCEQLGPNYNPVQARKECKIYIAQLKRVYGEPPFGASYKIQSNPHDFGVYYEVVCVYDDNEDEAREYAYKVEEGCEEWDDEAKQQLSNPAYEEFEQLSKLGSMFTIQSVLNHKTKEQS